MPGIGTSGPGPKEGSDYSAVLLGRRPLRVTAIGNVHHHLIAETIAGDLVGWRVDFRMGVVRGSAEVCWVRRWHCCLP